MAQLTEDLITSTAATLTFPPLSSVDLLPSTSPQGRPPHIISPVLRDNKRCVLEVCHRTHSEAFVFLSRADGCAHNQFRKGFIILIF